MDFVYNISPLKQVRIKQKTDGWIKTDILKQINDRDKAIREFKKFKMEKNKLSF